MKKNEKKFIVTESVLVRTLQYLGTKPFNEVANLVVALQASQEHIDLNSPNISLVKTDKLAELKE